LELTNDNVAGLALLCAEFGFRAFAAKLSAFKGSPVFRPVPASEDAEARLRIAALEERWLQRDHEIAELRSRISRLEAEVLQLRGAPKVSGEVSAPKGAPVSPSPPTVRLDSLIVSDFPDIFAEFRGKRISLLWRGSRDGFGVRDFHRCCDGHANTLTVILETDGNVFGGFTPMEWDSSGGEKADDSLRSFVFTLKNPHNIPARRFALKAEEKWRAIWCDSEWGPHFVDIFVSDDCNANTDSWTELGTAYPNDTGLDGETVFRGWQWFQEKEIEVMEITEYSSSKQIPLAGEGEIARQNLFCRRRRASAVPVRGRGWRQRQLLGFSVVAQTEMESITPGDNAPEIDRSRGSMHLSDPVLGRTPDSPGAKRQPGPDIFAVLTVTAREGGWRERELFVLINGKRSRISRQSGDERS
jgi:hypothetical protein